MNSVSSVSKKIGNTYFVWVKSSNQYLQFEEPAWIVYSKSEKKSTPDDIAKELTKKYGAALPESLKFVSDVQREFEKIVHAPNAKVEAIYNDENLINPPSFSVAHNYEMNNRVFKFYFQNRYFENFIHPLISGFVIEGTGQPDSVFELFGHENQIIFRVNGKTLEKWGLDETHLAKGKIFLELINLIYRKTDDDWLMTVHASALTNGEKSILFSAEPGSGKTTLAALLKARGYFLISDDFVPVEKKTFKAFPFPLAMSVKPGAMTVLSALYPELKSKPVNHISSQKSVRYLPLNLTKDFTALAQPVSDFVFVKYNKHIDFEMFELSKSEAVKKLLEQAWIFPSSENVASFFKWLEKTTFYNLTYTNTTKALETLEKIFANEKQ